MIEVEPDTTILSAYTEQLMPPEFAGRFVSTLIPNAADLDGHTLDLILTGFACGYITRKIEQEGTEALDAMRDEFDGEDDDRQD